VLIWLTQVVSLLGSGLSGFALGVWTYQTTGEVTELALMMLSNTLPGIVLGPVAGVFVDRWNRRWVMLLSDTVAALMTLVIAWLLFSGHLRPWHLYLCTAIASTASAFQQPAYLIMVSALVPAAHLGRANGLVQLGRAGAQLVAPIASAGLLVTIGLGGILLIDMASFLIAAGTLLLLRLPGEQSLTPATANEPLVASMREGGRYLWVRPGLSALLCFLAIGNFLAGVVEVLVTPLVLAFADVSTLGMLTTAAGLGLLAGSVVLSLWGGPKRKLYGVLMFQACCGLSLFFIGLGKNVALLAGLSFAFFFGIPIINGAIQTIFQQKVPLEMAGRVFAMMGAVTTAMLPLAYAIAAPLSDRVFEPALRPGGALVPWVGGFVGVGPGRGIAMMFSLSGLLTLFVTALATLYRPLRHVELELTDVVPPGSTAPRVAAAPARSEIKPSA
jgi:MFS family permease